MIDGTIVGGNGVDNLSKLYFFISIMGNFLPPVV